METIFAIANTWILPGWLLLLIAPSWKYTGKIVFYLIIGVLAITYTWLLLADISSFDPEAGSTLANISKAFGDPRVALIGWVHYLAFDLLAGLVIAMDARRVGVNRFLMVVPLFLTLMAGPFGLLVYALIRFSYTRTLDLPLQNRD
ncbi:MAG: ABA4-like family protein [Robiginitalea sp.]